MSGFKVINEINQRRLKAGIASKMIISINGPIIMQLLRIIFLKQISSSRKGFLLTSLKKAKKKKHELDQEGVLSEKD